VNALERKELVEDGRSASRRNDFTAADEAVRRWRRAHPMSLDGYFLFLESLQELLGPLRPSSPVTPDRDFRL
jgi:hypothetical protein